MSINPYFERYRPSSTNNLSTLEPINEKQQHYYEVLHNELRQNSQFIHEVNQLGLDPRNIRYQIKFKDDQARLCLFRHRHDPGILIQANAELDVILKKFNESPPLDPTPPEPPNPTPPEPPNPTPPEPPREIQPASTDPIYRVQERRPPPPPSAEVSQIGSHDSRLFTIRERARVSDSGSQAAVNSCPGPSPFIFPLPSTPEARARAGRRMPIIPAQYAGGLPLPPPPVPAQGGIPHANARMRHKIAAKDKRIPALKRPIPRLRPAIASALQHPAQREVLPPAPADLGVIQDRIDAIDRNFASAMREVDENQRRMATQLDDSLRRMAAGLDGQTRRFTESLQEQGAGMRRQIQDFRDALAAQNAEIAKLRQMPAQILDDFRKDLRHQTQTIQEQLDAFDKQIRQGQVNVGRELQALRETLATLQAASVTHDEISRIAAQLRTLEEQIARLRLDHDQSAELRAAQSQIETLRRDLDEKARQLEHQAQQHAGQLSSLEHDRKRLEANLASAEAKMAELKGSHQTELDTLNQRQRIALAEIEERLARSGVDLKEHLKQLEETRGRYSVLSKENERLGDENRRQTRVIEDLTAAKGRVEEEFEKTRKELQERLSKQAQQQQEQIDSKQRELDQTHRSLDQVRKENAEIGIELATAKERVRNLQAQLDTGTADNTLLQRQLRESRDEVARLTSVEKMLHGEQAKISELHQQIASQQTELGALRAKLEQANQAREELFGQRQKQQDQLSAAQRALDETKHHLEEIRGENAGIKIKLATAEERVRSLQAQLDTGAAGNTSLQRQLQEAKEEVARLKPVEKRLQEEEAKVLDLRQQVALQLKQLDEHHEKLEQAAKTQEQLAAQIQQQTDQIAARQSELDQASDRAREVEAQRVQIQALRDQIQRVDGIASKKTGDHAIVEDLNRELGTQLEEARRKLAENLRSISGLEQDLVTLESQHQIDTETHQREIDALTQQLSQARQENKRLQEELGGLEKLRKEFEELKKTHLELNQRLEKEQKIRATLEEKNKELTSSLESYHSKLILAEKTLEQMQLERADLMQANRFLSERSRLAAEEIDKNRRLISYLETQNQRLGEEIKQLRSLIESLQAESVIKKAAPSSQSAPAVESAADVEQEVQDPNPPMLPIAQLPENVIRCVPYLKALRTRLPPAERRKLKDIWKREDTFLNFPTESWELRYQQQIQKFVKLHKANPQTAQRQIRSDKFPFIAAFMNGIQHALARAKENPFADPLQNEEYKSLIIACYLHCALTTREYVTQASIKAYDERARDLIMSFEYDQGSGKYRLVETAAIEKESQQTANYREFILEFIKIHALKRALQITPKFINGWLKAIDEFYTTNLNQMKHVSQEMSKSIPK
jgi:chromosome segregation ATPase